MTIQLSTSPVVAGEAVPSGEGDQASEAAVPGKRKKKGGKAAVDIDALLADVDGQPAGTILFSWIRFQMQQRLGWCALKAVLTAGTTRIAIIESRSCCA